MTFINLALLGGASLIAIPIILHLIMRRKPKLLEFPALRFIQKRHDTNQRRLLLRHLLLLLLRMALIALLALSLTRPRIKFASRLGSQDAPVAAALIFDVGPHMQYVRDKKTRLETAQDLGKWLIEQLPKDSRIVVCTSGMAPQNFDADVQLSKQRMEHLEAVPSPQALTRILGETARVLETSDLAKEIYVFTDLARGSWPAEDAAFLQERLQALGGVSVYLIDVGVVDPSNFSLADLNLSRQVVSAGDSVDIRTEIARAGAEEERTIELLRRLPDGKEEKIGEQIKRLKPGEVQTVEFRLPSLKPGLQQGVVRITGQDSLAADDARYFSIEVRPPWKVLVAAQPPTSDSAVYLTSAIAPLEMQKRGSARFACTVIDYGQLVNQPLDDFSAVCLLDPPGLEPGVWQRLTDYATAGHGVGVFLGRHALPVEAFNSPAAQQLLPGQIKEQVPREGGDNYLAPQDFQNPILRPFAPLATKTPWNRFPVYRYWRIDNLNVGASTVMTYNDGRPALLERSVGEGRVAGRVVMMSTPFSDRISRRDAWNVLPSSTEIKAWPFVILANQIASYLVGSGEQQMNYYVGTSAVTVPVGEPGRLRTYVLSQPDGTGSPLPAPEKALLSIGNIDKPGNYQVQSVGEPAEPDRGFSMNLLSRTTQLARVGEEELDALFGPVKPQTARNSDEIVRNVHDSRVGREVYPWLIALFAGLLALEYVVSNWFYRKG